MNNITLYTSSCTTCGKDKQEIAALQRFCWQNNISLAIHNSKYSAEHRESHSRALQELDMRVDSYPAVITTDDGLTCQLKDLDYSKL